MEKEFLGLTQVSDLQKKQIYEILLAYSTIRTYLVKNLGLRLDDLHLAGAVGMLVERGTEIDEGMKVGYYWKTDLDRRQEFFENFAWNRLGDFAGRMTMVADKLIQVKSIGWGMKMLIWLKYNNWSKSLLDLAKFGLFLLVFSSLLYFLVATQWGRDLTWEFLNVYGWVIKLILIVFLIIGLVVIVGMVSFMYLESRNRKEENKL